MPNPLARRGLVLLSVLLLVGGGSSASGAAQPTALTATARLVVKAPLAMTGYARQQFGPAWADVDHNRCDTRDDVLRRDLTRVQLRPGTHGCIVVSGTLADPYTRTSIAYARGGGASVDIDHVVALGDAWQTGAGGWPAARREALANDPLNLLAVDASANRQKGDSDAAGWLPPNRAYRCAYVARQVAVKLKYALWVSAPERDAMRSVLATCPGRRLPGTSTAPAATVAAARVFRTCAEARAAGVTPIRRGTKLYAANAKLDRDKDGVACE